MTPIQPASPRPSATVVVLRVGDSGSLEVLLVRRREGTGFAAGAWVFPGGVVDPADRSLPGRCRRSTTLAARSQRLRTEAGQTLGWHVAGVRETFEEAGLLFARQGDGRAADLAAIDASEMRRRLVAREVGAKGFAAWLNDAGLVCDLDALAPYRRMVTPQQSPQRFDTLFLLAAAPAGQHAVPDGRETTDLRWLAPGDALGQARAGRLTLIHPTIRALEGIADVADVEAAVARGHGSGAIPPVLPHLDLDGNDHPQRLLEPGDEDYPVEVLAREFAEWGDLDEWREVPAWSR